MTLFSLLLLGGTRAFAGSGGDDGNSQGQNNQGDNNQGNNGGLINWIDNLLNDIFGSDNNNNQGDNSNCSGTPGTTNGGGGTAPIDGGISLLLAAGVGLGVRKLAKRP